MKIDTIHLTYESWNEKFVGRASLMGDDGTAISLRLPDDVVEQIGGLVTKHVKKDAQKRSVDFFNGMQNVGLPALEHHA